MNNIAEPTTLQDVKSYAQGSRSPSPASRLDRLSAPSTFADRRGHHHLAVSIAAPAPRGSDLRREHQHKGRADPWSPDAKACHGCNTRPGELDLLSSCV